MSRVIDGLNNFLKKTREIDQIVENHNLPSIEFLFDDFKGIAPVNRMNNEDVLAYEGLKFYEEKLQKPHKGIQWTERLENLAIWGLYILALVAIFISF